MLSLLVAAAFALFTRANAVCESPRVWITDPSTNQLLICRSATFEVSKCPTGSTCEDLWITQKACCGPSFMGIMKDSSFNQDIAILSQPVRQESAIFLPSLNEFEFDRRGRIRSRILERKRSRNIRIFIPLEDKHTTSTAATITTTTTTETEPITTTKTETEPITTTKTELTTTIFENFEKVTTAPSFEEPTNTTAHLLEETNNEIFEEDSFAASTTVENSDSVTTISQDPNTTEKTTVTEEAVTEADLATTISDDQTTNIQTEIEMQTAEIQTETEQQATTTEPQATTAEELFETTTISQITAEKSTNAPIFREQKTPLPTILEQEDTSKSTDSENNLAQLITTERSATEAFAIEGDPTTNLIATEAIPTETETVLIPTEQEEQNRTSSEEGEVQNARPLVFVLQEGRAEQTGRGQYRLPASISLIVDGDRHILVDTGIPTDSGVKDVILNGLKERGLEPSDIHFVVTTHGHPDHFGHLNLFPDALQYFGNFMYFGNTFTFTDLYAAESVPLTTNVKLYRTPGHTPQDISVVVRNVPFKGTVAVVGDLFMAREDIDFPDMWEPLSWDVGVQRANRRLVICEVDYIIPGHGIMFPVTDTLRDRFKCSGARRSR